MSGPLGLGTAPSITDPDAAQNFSVLADAFFQSLKTFEQNLAAYGNGVSMGFYSPSSSTITIPSVSAGSSTSVTLTVATGKGYVAGMPVAIASQTNATGNRMIGSVSSYNSTTGVMSVDVVHTVGSGSISSWHVIPCAPIQSTLLWTLVDSTASANIDCGVANYFKRSVSAATTFTFSNAPSGQAYSFTLEVDHTAGSITWPTTVVWPFGITSPSLTSGKKHLFVFATSDGGATWRGSYLANYPS